MLKQRVEEWVKAHEQEIIEWNRQLVSIPSMNRFVDGDEAEAQKVMKSRLEQLGCEVEMFLPTDVTGIESHPAFLKGRNYENRPNVVGKMRGSGSGRSLMFSGHMDTVPLADSKWTFDPFGGIVKGGRQYGLGLFDMKGGLAAAVAALTAFKELGVKLKGDVLIESVVDEEFGGANGTLANRLKGFEADLTIVPEPTNMAICPATHGGGMYRFTYKGAAGRGFSGEKLSNPAFAGARFLEIFKKYQRHHAAKSSPSVWFETGTLPAFVQGVQAGSPEYGIYDRSPASCSIDVWIQCYPGTTEAELHQDLMSFYEEHATNDDLLSDWSVHCEKLIRFLPGMETKRSEAIVPFLQEVSRNLTADGFPVHGAELACDAFMFDQYSDTSVVICGPVGGNAHTGDEYIELSPFFELIQYYALTMAAWCGLESST